MTIDLRFNKAALDNLPLPATGIRDTYRDTKIPQLELRVSHSGVKSFSVLKRVRHGDGERVTIGRYPELTVEAARNEASQIVATLAQGTSVTARRKEEKQQRANEKTPALHVWMAYIEAKESRWSDSHLADHKKVIQPGGITRTRGKRPNESPVTQPGVLLQLLSLPLSQIDEDVVGTWLKSESEKRPTHTRLAFSLLKAFLNWCRGQKAYKNVVKSNPCNDQTVKDEVPKRRAKKDALQKEQLASWFKHVSALSSPQVSACLQMMLLTGARPNEAVSLRWENVSFQWNTITINDKCDGSRTIPLTPYVKSLLESLKKINDTRPAPTRMLNGRRIPNDLENWKPSQWVFSSKTSKSGHLEDPSSGHAEALAAAEIPHISLHGLRRSFSSITEWIQLPAGVVAQIMGHKPSATAERHYKVRPIDLLRIWHTMIETWILSKAQLTQVPDEGGSHSKRSHLSLGSLIELDARLLDLEALA